MNHFFKKNILNSSYSKHIRKYAKKLKVSFEVNDEEKTISLLAQSYWKNKLESNAKTVFMFSLENDEIANLNKYLVENGIAVSAVIPTRSLEDYFLKITDEVV